MMKLIMVNVGFDVTDPLLHQTVGAVAGRDAVIVLSGDLIGGDFPTPIPVEPRPKELLELEYKSIPVFDRTVILREKKPFQRSSNKYQNKRKHRRH